MSVLPTLLLSIALNGPRGLTGPAGNTDGAPSGSGRDATERLAPYRVLDNVEGAHVDLGIAPIRPLAIDPVSGSLFALNSHDSRLVEFDLDSGEERRSAPLPWGPTAVAVVPADALGDLVVVSRGSHVLVRLDRATLEVRALVPLPHEPADLVVPSADGSAFVSCSGAREVVEVDVYGGEILQRYPIEAVEPTFLAVRWVDGQPNVLVAPRASGNNSMADEGPHELLPGPGRVLDLEDPDVALQGLPDHDLFSISPGSDAVPVARAAGAVLFAVGVQPTTGWVWQLGTEAVNKDPDRQGEPAVRGIFVENQIAITVLPNAPGPPVRPRGILKLDDSDPNTPGIQFDPARVVGQPYALAFDGSGRAYVTGLLTDNVTQLSPTGSFEREWDVGNIPRGILVDEAGERAWVLNWGTNRVESWNLASNPPSLRFDRSLGFDPTPEPRRQGRHLFFEGSHSLHDNVSCNSCHIEGGSDSLAWDLSGLPYDDKGALVTQTLVGIADLLPYHWRGERGDLIDFNPAFDGLLGGAPLDQSPGGAFEAFQAWVFSLEQPANPNQHPRRLVDAARGFDTPDGAHRAGDAVAGQRVYFEKIVDQVETCNGCHTLPTGTNNDVNIDVLTSQDARRHHKVVASYNGLWRKDPPSLETVVLADGTNEVRPTLGAAISSAGLKDSVEEFVDIDLFTLTPQEVLDVTAFVMQTDSGLAPAVHRAWLVDGETLGRAAHELRVYLLPQAAQRNCDVAVFGTLDDGGGPRPMRWFWERGTQRFLAEDSRLPSMTFDELMLEAAFERGRFVFLGLPVGMAERFAVDYDEDALFNVDEQLLGTDVYDPDTDGDGDPDGHEVEHGGDPLDMASTGNDRRAPTISNVRHVFVTTRVAKVLFETDEPATWRADWAGGSRSGVVGGSRLEKTHTLLLRELTPNTLYGVTLTAIDAAGNRRSVVLDPIRSQQATFPNDVVFDDGSVEVLQNDGGTLQFRLSGIVSRKVSRNAASGFQLRVDVYVNDVLVQENAVGTTSNASGATQVTLTRGGLVPGDVVTANLRSLFTAGAGSLLWSMPDNDPRFLRFDVTYTGP